MGPLASFLVHVVLLEKPFVAFYYCPHIHILLKLAFCSGFPFSQTVLPVSYSTMQSPVILHGHPVGLGPRCGGLSVGLTGLGLSLHVTAFVQVAP